MAQVLKAEYRQAIMSAAKKEFYTHGLQGASMRSIAKAASMSTGNLYRYFKNKEALAQAILADTLEKLDQVIAPLMEPEQAKKSDERLEYFQHQLEKMADDLVDVFIADQQEFIILMYHSHYADQLILWFKSALTSLVNHWFPDLSSNRQIELLCHMLSDSIIAGLTRGFKESVNMMKPEEIRWAIGTYLHLYTLMLSAGGEHYEKV